jgi:RNA polymerase sigma factor (sigma-70 family)
MLVRVGARSFGRLLRTLCCWEQRLRVDSLDDADLLALLHKGEMRALNELVERYCDPLRGYLFRLLGGDRALAEDLAQEAFLRVLRRLKEPDELAVRSFKAWLFAIATNLARDWHRRTHELVMSSALPTWAYIWGRYLVATAVSLFFAVELLLAILLVIAVEHETKGGADFPAAQPDAVLATWAAVVLPTTIFVGGLSVALSTLFFRATTLVKVATALGWFIWMVAVSPITQANANVPQWLLRWDPTYVGLVEPSPSYDIYYRALSAGVAPLESSGQPVSQDQLLSLFHQVVNTLPDIDSWLPPHVAWAALALGLVALTSRMFKRYRNAA